eukprot:g33542.t1
MEVLWQLLAIVGRAMRNGHLAYFLITGVIVLAISLRLIKIYARRSVESFVKLTTVVSWFLAFSVVTLLPYDLLTPTSSSPEIQTLWGIIYWFSYVMTWLGIPLMQAYIEAGDFTFLGRCWSALVENVIYYLVVGVIFIGFLIYISFTEGLSGGETLHFAVTLGNIWGITVSVLLLGYGLVELPRSLWRKTNPLIRLNLVYFRANRCWEETEESKEELYQTWKLLKLVRERLDRQEQTADVLKLSERLSKVEEKCPPLENFNMATLGDPSHFDELSIAKSIKKHDPPRLKDIVKLHVQVKYMNREFWLIEAQWKEIIEKEAELTKLINTAQEPSPPGGMGRLLWLWETKWKKKATKMTAVLLAMLSLLLFWSEMTLLAPMDLSPFSHLIRHLIAKEARVAVQFFSFIPLSYLTTCCLFGLWRLRLSKYYCMRGKARTDGNSLLFNSSWCLRLTAPLGLNFCNLLHITDSDFYAMVGVTGDIPVVGGFQKFAPILLGILCTLTLFGAFNRLMKLLGMNRFEFSSKYANDALEEGKANLVTVKKERAKRDGARQQHRLEEARTKTTQQHRSDIGNGLLNGSAPASDDPAFDSGAE